MCSDQIPPKPRFACGGLIEPNPEAKYAIYITHKKTENTKPKLRLQQFMFVGRIYYPDGDVEERLYLKNTNQN